jgi:hypothetical protein
VRRVVGSLRPRLATWARRTPGRLILITAGLLVLGLAAGAAGVTSVRQRTDLIDGVAASNGTLAVAAQELYRALSDADATVANAFLLGGAEPAPLRERYQSDVTAASAALVRLAGGVTDGPGAAAVEQIAAYLPVYTGLVETARSLNRQGLPIGSAYLREASGLLRQTLLPAAHDLYRAVSGRLTKARDRASAFPWLALPLGLLTLGGLVAAQIFLARRTRRVFNVGLVLATVAGLTATLWLGAARTSAGSHLESSRYEGSTQVDLLVEARIAALQARGDEALTLVARGAGATFDSRFNEAMERLVGPDGQSGLLGQAVARTSDVQERYAIYEAIEDVKRWRAIHQRVRELDDAGRNAEAAALAIGVYAASAGALFGAVDADLADSIERASAILDDEVAQAGDAFGGAAASLGALTVLLLLGAAVGMTQRIMEYR